MVVRKKGAASPLVLFCDSLVLKKKKTKPSLMIRESSLMSKEESI